MHIHEELFSKTQSTTLEFTIETGLGFLEWCLTRFGKDLFKCMTTILPSLFTHQKAYAYAKLQLYSCKVGFKYRLYIDGQTWDSVRDTITNPHHACCNFNHIYTRSQVQTLLVSLSPFLCALSRPLFLVFFHILYVFVQ